MPVSTRIHPHENHVWHAWPRSQLWHRWTCHTLAQQISPKLAGHYLPLQRDSCWVLQMWLRPDLHTSHVFQADLFDLPWKNDTVSQPPKAWKKRIPHVFSGPMAETTSCIGIHLVFPLLPKVTHIFSRPSFIKEGITEVAMITMSVSLALIIRDWCPCFTACWAWRRICVSASSWLHKATASKLAAWLLTAPTYHVLLCHQPITVKFEVITL